MAKMTEEEADRLDELYTKTTPKIDPNKPGFFARQETMAVFLDEFTAKYLTAKTIATNRSTSELIADMVRKELAEAQ
jgi:hypothetical protein